MKKLFSVLILASLFALSAHAGLQVFNVTTNQVLGSTATNYTATAGTVSAANSSEITIQVSSTSSGADTSNKTWVFNGSVDNTIWTSNVLAITYASIGTAQAGGITNLPTGYRYPFLQLNYVTNAAASVSITNMTAKVYTKTGI